MLVVDYRIRADNTPTSQRSSVRKRCGKEPSGYFQPCVADRGRCRVHLPDETARSRCRSNVRPELTEVFSNFDSDFDASGVSTFAVELTRDWRRGPSTPKGKPVFFSYQRNPDAGWATHFAQQLEEKYGVNVFLDARFNVSAQGTHLD
jgi:hypothetical protein